MRCPLDNWLAVVFFSVKRWCNEHSNKSILMGERFSIIGSAGVPASYGGFETLVENLLPSDQIALIYCSSSAYAKKLEKHKGSRLKYLPFRANGVQSIFYDSIAIFHSLVFTNYSLLILGVSGAIAIPIFKLFSHRKIVINIDGLEWHRDKWGRFAKWFLRFSEGVAVKFADIIVCDNQVLADYVKETYGENSTVIAYGGDHAVRAVFDVRIPKKKYGLALCRIEPENNVEMILEAFSRVEEVEIFFIGNWDNSEYGRLLKKRYGQHKNIRIMDPIYDLDICFRYAPNVFLCSWTLGGRYQSISG